MHPDRDYVAELDAYNRKALAPDVAGPIAVVAACIPRHLLTATPIEITSQMWSCALDLVGSSDVEHCKPINKTHNLTQRQGINQAEELKIKQI